MLASVCGSDYILAFKVSTKIKLVTTRAFFFLGLFLSIELSAARIGIQVPEPEQHKLPIGPDEQYMNSFPSAIFARDDSPPTLVHSICQITMHHSVLSVSEFSQNMIKAQVSRASRLSCCMTSCVSQIHIPSISMGNALCNPSLRRFRAMQALLKVLQCFQLDEKTIS